MYSRAAPRESTCTRQSRWSSAPARKAGSGADVRPRCGRGGGRTLTPLTRHRLLRPARLPFRHSPAGRILVLMAQQDPSTEAYVWPPPTVGMGSACVLFDEEGRVLLVR